jgi:hypothetical protein
MTLTPEEADSFALSGLASYAEWRTLSPGDQAALQRAGERRMALEAVLRAKAARGVVEAAEVLSVVDGGVAHREVQLDVRTAGALEAMRQSGEAQR